MPRLVLSLGPLSVIMKYLTRKPSGLWMYQRRIPLDMRKHYPDRVMRKLSLETYSEAEAAQRCMEQTQRDEALWASLRSPEATAEGRSTPENAKAAHELLKVLGLKPGEAHSPAGQMTDDAYMALEVFTDHLDRRTQGAYKEAHWQESQGDDAVSASALLLPAERIASKLLTGDPSQKLVILSDVLDSYLKHKGGGDKFDLANRRYVRLLTDAYGDLTLSDYSRASVNSLRDKMIADGSKTATVKRYFKSLSAIFHHGIDEFDLKGVQNPFVRFKIPKDGQDAKTRPTFTIDELKCIQAQCKALDDSPRHLVAMQSDTGARIGEIVGLRIEDIVLKHATPHMILRENKELGRSLKTDNSARTIPLVGASLWGAQRAIELRGGATKGWLFPQYASDGDIKATHATNTVNKWLKKTLKIPKTSHSFRHSIADRLRHVGVREELIEAIGGWKSYASMVRSYGSGHMIGQLHAELSKVVL